jgi:hypothetical protein
MTDQAQTSETPTVTPQGHKNQPVGPTTGKPLPDWRKSRDYEQFMPTANM